jgi:orotidine-5'-phosphate decarboxylase
MDSGGLFHSIRSKRSFLCVGLDTDIKKIPQHLLEAEDPVFEFNRQIIDATYPYAVAYKPNVAFYEVKGAAGWRSLERTAAYIREKDPSLFVIADAKRGDIGNTSRLYARAFFEEMDVDALTVAPYMGHDSVGPFLEYPGKWVILLALPSNPGADDFQFFSDGRRHLFEQVLETAKGWASPDALMFVTGATRAEKLAGVRKIVPDHFLLVPGVGAQGGSLEEVARYGMNDRCGLLVNSSRGIIYAGGGRDFAAVAAAKAKELQEQMEQLLREKGIL